MHDEIICQGYLRDDGKKGIRNKVLIIYTVNCSQFVAKSVKNNFSVLKGEDVDVLGFEGCFDNELVIRMFLGYIRHPNVGAVLAVGHGCEYISAQKLAEYAEKQGKLAAWYNVQDVGGTRKGIEKGTGIVKDFLGQLENTKKVPMKLSDMVFGGECGGSDFTSGLAGNSVVGKFFDNVIDAGGTAIFEEIVECIGLKDFLVNRAVDENAAKDIAFVYDKGEKYSKDVRQFSISPGNFVGGLTTIEEKSMGAVVKSGSRPIQGVIGIGEEPRGKGLWLMDSVQDEYYMDYGFTNSNDSEGVVDLTACGAHIVFLVTGRGHTIGGPISPVIKVTGNARTYEKLSEDIDFNASPILTGEWSLDMAAEKLREYVVKICNGGLTTGEELGHDEYYIHYNYQNPACRNR